MGRSKRVNRGLQQTLLAAFQRSIARAEREQLDLRTAALIEGVSRVAEAKLARGLFP